MQPNYYMILGIEQTANSLDIKKAYRSLALKYHPDMNQGDEWAEEKFKLISQAYEVLKKSETRKIYDRNLLKDKKDKTQKRRNHKEVFNMPGDELLRDFYKGFYLKQDKTKIKSFKGDDIRQNLKISFNDAASGTKANILIPNLSICTLCCGTGIKPGAKTLVCPECNGRGIIKDKRGFYQMCIMCKGAGTTVSAHCNKCHGRGKIWTRKVVRINIPPGVETGTRLQIKGMGMQGKNGGKSGDFIVVVNVEKHPFFKQEGLDIACRVPISFISGMQGSEVFVPTIEGLKKIEIPPGTVQGTTIRMHGLGIYSKDKKKQGDLIIIIDIEMPKRSSGKKKKGKKILSVKENASTYPETERFKKKIKKYYYQNRKDK